ncbi:MAG: hypothetical protein R3338_05630 [Thermoanaerobaculia bacterium]|nr:hypothetical protein [Thermoanaerobaculia bacterium]
MTGARLLTGAIAMGAIVPVLLFVLLDLSRPIELFVLSITCFVGWGVADLIAVILSRTRIEDRTAREALEQWERNRTPRDEESS